MSLIALETVHQNILADGASEGPQPLAGYHPQAVLKQETECLMANSTGLVSRSDLSFATPMSHWTSLLNFTKSVSSLINWKLSEHCVFCGFNEAMFIKFLSRGSVVQKMSS